MARTSGPGRRPARLATAIRLAVALAVALLAAAVSPATAFACSCVRQSLPEYVDRADVIFAGVVATTRPARDPSPDHVEISFTVERVYKGAAYRQQVVTTRESGAECGLRVEPGARLVVFADQPTDADGGYRSASLRTGLCDGNLRTSSPPAALGDGYPALTGSSQHVDRAARVDHVLSRALAIGGLAVAGAVLVAGTGLVLLWRRRPA